MNPLAASNHRNGVSRRDALRAGGLVLSMGAIAAACGSGRGGSDAPGRLGVAPPPATLPEDPVDDITLLRTAQSIEHTALEVYSAAGATGALSSDESTLVARLVADHTGHSAQLGSLITGLGGSEFACANPFLMDRAVMPILGALDGSDDLHRDLLNIAHAFESFAGASYQALVSALTAGDLRRAAVQIGGEEQRHATVLARIINPDDTFASTFFGTPIEKDDEGFPVPYAIPSVFGRLAGIEVVVGARNEEGARFSTQLQTPAANSFVYSYQSC